MPHEETGCTGKTSSKPRCKELPEEKAHIVRKPELGRSKIGKTHCADQQGPEATAPTDQREIGSERGAAIAWFQKRLPAQVSFRSDCEPYHSLCRHQDHFFRQKPHSAGQGAVQAHELLVEVVVDQFGNRF